jgi:hypothetical protein
MFCKACGSRLPEGASFCVNCGSAVDAPTGQPPVAATAAGQPPVERTPPEQATLTQPTEIRPRVVAERASTLVPPPAPTFSTPLSPQEPPAPTYGRGYGPQGQAGYPYAPPPASGQGAPPPRRRSRLGLWIGIAAAVVIVAGAGVAAWQLALDKNGTNTATTLVAKATSTTVRASSTTSTSQPTSSTSGSSSTTLALSTGAPGDSVGEWAEMNIADLPQGASAVAVSDQALLTAVEDGNGAGLYAYMFNTRQFVELPIEATNFYNEDIEGNIAIWWEGDYDSSTDEYSNEHIYAYSLPNGPKVEIAGGGGALYYPQIAGSWVTWAEEEPLAESPEEYSLVHIYGVKIDSKGVPQGDAVELVPEATAYLEGDAAWSYSLSSTHLAWENATSIDSYDPGIYMMDLESRQPRIVETDVWRPTLGGKTLVYTRSGLVATSVDGGAVTTLDPLGDFATAASTFAAYFRSVDNGGSTAYEIVARGFTGAYEQVLGQQTDAPWLSPPIVASDHHVAFTANGVAHVFEWQGLKTY